MNHTKEKIESPPKNRKYKPLLKTCMKDFFALYQQVDKYLHSGESWDIQTIFPEIKQFLKSYLIATQSYKEGEMLWLNKRIGYLDYKVFAVILSGYCDLLIAKDEITLIVKTLNILKLNLLEWIKTNEIPLDVPDEFLPNTTPPHSDAHFLLIGEDRRIISKLSPAAIKRDQPDLDYILSLSGTSIPHKDFEKSAIDAIRNQEDDTPPKTSLKISSVQELYFIVKPTTAFSRILLSINSPDQTNHKETNKNKIFNIPSLHNAGFSSFTVIVQSLFVQFFVSFDTFEAITLCDVCNTLIFRKKLTQKENPEVICEKYKSEINYCSDKCKNFNNAWKKNNPRQAFKNDCHGRQKGWFERNCKLKGSSGSGYYKTIKVSKKGDFCTECKIRDYLEGGECPKLWEIYGEKVIEYKEYKHSFRIGAKKHILTYDQIQCRKGQRDCYKMKLGEKIRTPSYKSCVDCPSPHDLPADGDCPIFKKKFKKKFETVT